MPSHRVSTGSRAACPPRRLLQDAGGQGTLEYALVLFAFLGMMSGAAVLWHMLEAALPVQHALQSASHHVASVAPGAFSDVFMY